jgi:hypothetical protein
MIEEAEGRCPQTGRGSYLPLAARLPELGARGPFALRGKIALLRAGGELVEVVGYGGADRDAQPHLRSSETVEVEEAGR